MEGDLDLSFEDESKSLDQIIANSRLPIVVKYDSMSQEVDPVLVGPTFDPSQALLIHSTLETRRVYARSASFRPDTKCFEEAGLDVTVDEQYAGWFAVFGHPTEHRGDPVVPHFRNIGKLAISPCCKFLVSGTRPLEAMKVLRLDNEKSDLKPFEIQPGTVLSKKGMYTVSLEIKIRKSMFKKKVVKKDEMYMACCDELNNEMLIPCQAQGIFYVLAQASGQIKTPVMRIADILSRYRFPLMVKLVHGDAFQMPPTCKGTFILLASERTRTSFSSTLCALASTVFEISSDATLRFFQAKNLPDLESPSVYCRVLQNCAEKASLHLQTIRFRRSDIGLTSARSSATSGHGSGVSLEEDRVDWSKISPCSNAPFLEAVDISVKTNVLFTHHASDPATPQLQTQLSQSKDKKTKVETKGIKRMRLYDTPVPKGSDAIPIVNRQASTESRKSSVSDKDRSYENTGSNASSPSSEGGSRDEYFELWSDRSSVLSGDSLSMVVENVTITSVPEELSHQYANFPLDLNANRQSEGNGELTPPSTGELQVQEENVYDLLSEARFRSMRNGYVVLDEVWSDLETNNRSSDISSVSNRGSSSHGIPEPTYRNSIQSDGNPYVEPINGNYDTPRRNTYLIPNNQLSYVIPTSTQANLDNSFQDDSHPYERVDDLFEEVGDANGTLGVRTSSSQRTSSTNEGQYVNIIIPDTPGSQTLYIQTQSGYVVPSSLSDEARSQSLPPIKTSASTGVYVNTLPPTNEACSGRLDILLSSMKGLKLKTATEEAIKNVDINKFESILGSDDVRSSLYDLFPGVNKIDLNKISLLIDVNQKS